MHIKVSFYSVFFHLMYYRYSTHTYHCLKEIIAFKSIIGGVVFQSLIHVWHFVTPWTAACQVPPSFTISLSLLKLTSIELMMLSNQPILCCPLLILQSFPASGSFPMSQLFASGGQSVGTSASAPALPMNIQGWFSLGSNGLISLLSKGLSRVFSRTTFWKHQFFGTQPSQWSNSHIHTWLLEKP